MPPSSHRHALRACAKRNSHDNFIPINHLSLEHFPDEDLHSGLALWLVRRLARLVVRVRVVGRGVCRMKTCTGVVTSLGEDGEEVTVTIPLHSVQNDVEVAQTTAEFFYDAENADDIVIVNGVSLVRHDSQHIAQLTCWADPDLRRHFQRWREELSAMSAGFSRELEDLNPGLAAQGSTVESSTGRGNLDLVRRPQGCAVVLISHPHGFSKRVSLGAVCGRGVVGRSGGEGGGGLVDCDMGDEGEGLWMSSRHWGISSSKTSGEEVTAMSQPSLLLCLSSQPSSSSSCSSSQSSSEQLLTLKEKLEEKLTDDQSSVTFSDSQSLWKRNSMRVSVHNKITAEEETTFTGTTTPAWNKILSLRSASISGTATQVWNKVLSLCCAVCRLLGNFGPGMFDARKRISPCPEIVPIYHSAASCPGSSGGVVIVIGWVGLAETVTSLPVYLHVGVRENRGVAVPVIVSREVLSLCFGRV